MARVGVATGDLSNKVRCADTFMRRQTQFIILVFHLSEVYSMKKVAIIMGSDSDLPVVEKAAQ
ncbi:MAG: hypothetical protein IKT81_01575, partial [Clostridia bacterium]|nr:hypothetical protein [Clostridia bacterium]